MLHHTHHIPRNVAEAARDGLALRCLVEGFTDADIRGVIAWRDAPEIAAWLAGELVEPDDCELEPEPECALCHGTRRVLAYPAEPTRAPFWRACWECSE